MVQNKQYRPLDPALERPDGYQFKLGELVKCKDPNDKWVYFYVLEDNRTLSHCNYLYTIDPVIPEPTEDGRVVYGCEPINMEPTTIVEKILYGQRT